MRSIEEIAGMITDHDQFRDFLLRIIKTEIQIHSVLGKRGPMNETQERLITLWSAYWLSLCETMPEDEVIEQMVREMVCGFLIDYEFNRHFPGQVGEFSDWMLKVMCPKVQKVLEPWPHYKRIFQRFSLHAAHELNTPIAMLAKETL